MSDLKQIAATISEAASGEAVKSFDRLTEKTDTVAKMRLEFFDRIVLLDGGTVALSLTLLGFLAAKNPHGVKYPTLIVLAWISFLVSMVLALTRNWLEHDRLGKAESNNYIVAVNQSMVARINFAKTYSGESPETNQAAKIVEEGNKLLADQYKKHESLLWWVRFIGASSLVMMVLGFVLLLLFASRNISSL
jgi:hypothetical protein